MKVGVWSMGSEAAVKNKIQKVFGNYHNSLLFLFPDDKPDRDLRRVWFNFPDFSVNNTFFITGNSLQVPKEQECCLLRTGEFKGEKQDVFLTALESYLGFFFFKQAERKITTVPQLALKINWKHFYSQYVGPGDVEDLSSQRFK